MRNTGPQQPFIAAPYRAWYVGPWRCREPARGQLFCGDSIMSRADCDRNLLLGILAFISRPATSVRDFIAQHAESFRA